MIEQTGKALTFWMKFAEAGLMLKLLSPPYVAVIVECEPADDADVVNVAWPVPSSVPVPNVVPPSLKVTVPVGVPDPGELTVTNAVNVTGCPKQEGLGDEPVTVVVVLALFTFCVKLGEVLVLKLLSPA